MLLLLQSSPYVGHDITSKPDYQPSLVRYVPMVEDDDLLLLWWGLNEQD